MNIAEYDSPTQTISEIKNILVQYPKQRANMIAAEAELRDQEGRQRWTCEQTENYTKKPNILIDKAMALLTGDEWKVLDFIIRRTEGFHKATDTIASFQFIDGITKKDGAQLDSGTGLSRNRMFNALGGLEEANIVFKIKTGQYNAYGLTREKDTPFDGSLINWKFLHDRKQKQDKANKKRVAAARKKRAENLDKKRANILEFDGDY